MKKYFLRGLRLIIIFSIFFITTAVTGNNLSGYFQQDVLNKKKDVIVIHNADIDKSAKEALLILPGFGDSKKGRKHQKKFFENTAYDLYIPDFKDRKSFEGSVKKLTEFYFNKELDKYKKVHVFSYIMGSWVINTFIGEYGKRNISTIVYDRSPPQERAPKLMAEKFSPIGKIVVGQVLVDLSKIDYPPIEQDGINIGIMVESKATFLIRLLKKPAMSYGEIDWDAASFNQAHDDLMYTVLNHDQMYIRFDIIGENILKFIKSGRFLDGAQRSPYDWDIFKPVRSL